jgi:hypothetical protein
VEIKLQIGGNKIETGFIAADTGKAFALPYEDGLFHEIAVAETLERLSHRDSLGAIKHWASKLMPGGKLEIQVPDLLSISRRYLDGEPVDIQRLLMGNQETDGQCNGSLFDRETLAEAMAIAGLERIGDAEAPAGFIRLRAFRPTSSERKITGVAGCVSVPRYGPTMLARYTNQLGQLGIPYYVGQGAYWHEILCELIEKRLDEGCEYLLTTDYDSHWSPADLRELYRLMKAFPEADAICPVQQHRGRQSVLVGVLRDGKPVGEMRASEFDRSLTKITTGHFGLTLFRADKLRALPRPWMVPSPNDQGRWDKGTQADIQFWLDWEKAGNTLYLANRVPIGHQVELILWPSREFGKPVYQSLEDYQENGVPAEVAR